jgi:lambda repressor-like predicted transcriptional regulator
MRKMQQKKFNEVTICLIASFIGNEAHDHWNGRYHRIGADAVSFGYS